MGNHEDTRWVEFEGNAGCVLRVEAEEEFSFGALHYTQEQLTEAQHTNELLPEEDIMLCVDVGHHGLGSASWRLWSSPYFVSMRAMLEMSCVRGILAIGWFAFLSPILIAVVIDAWVVRRLKYESFAVHHPTLYQVALSSPTVLLICAFAVMLMPWFIPAWVAALFYVAFLMSIHLIVSNFHRFG